MKRVIISESDRKNILRAHGILKEEESLTPAQMLQKIQGAVGAKLQDAIIGPDTASKIADALKDVPNETVTKFDFSCVKGNTNKKTLSDFDDETEKAIFKGYQIGNLVFDKVGTYYDIKDPNTKYKYSCVGTTISTEKHENIKQDQTIGTESQKGKEESLKSEINRLKNFEGVTNEYIVNILKQKNYSDEDIMKADPALLGGKVKSSEETVSLTGGSSVEGSPMDI
jgi:hypothetical protein